MGESQSTLKLPSYVAVGAIAGFPDRTVNSNLYVKICTFENCQSKICTFENCKSKNLSTQKAVNSAVKNVILVLIAAIILSC